MLFSGEKVLILHGKNWLLPVLGVERPPSVSLTYLLLLVYSHIPLPVFCWKKQKESMQPSSEAKQTLAPCSWTSRTVSPNKPLFLKSYPASDILL
jgi:hypothetical protein